MHLRNEKKEQTRHTLIAAALKLSAGQGFAALSLREIAREAEVSPTAFYRHFRDMDELALALVDEVGLSLRQLMRRARRDRKAQKRGIIRASIESFMTFVTQNANHFRLLLGERSGSSPAFRKALHAEIDRFVGELNEDIIDGFTAMNIPVDHTALAAEAIVAVVFTVGAEALDLLPHRRADLSERLILEVRMIIDGLILSSRRPKGGRHHNKRPPGQA